MNINEYLEPVNSSFYHRNHIAHDTRLAELIPKHKYEESPIVIIACPQDEGIKRNNGREGAGLAPDKIRRQFYQFTNFGITKKIFDLGNVKIQNTLEETHEVYFEVVKKLLSDGKKVISLGGGNDISYPIGKAMFENFEDNWVAINVNPLFDVQINETRNNQTAFRQLLDEKFLHPNYFYEIAYQSQLNSPIYFRQLYEMGVNLMSIEQLRSTTHVDENLKELLRNKFIKQSSSLNVFFNFNIGAIRASDAPGTTNPSPVGLRTGEFLTLVKFAASLANTKIIQFTEVNPNFDNDNLTTQLVALAIHRFCSNLGMD